MVAAAVAQRRQELIWKEVQVRQGFGQMGHHPHSQMAVWASQSWSYIRGVIIPGPETQQRDQLKSRTTSGPRRHEYGCKERPRQR